MRSITTPVGTRQSGRLADGTHHEAHLVSAGRPLQCRHALLPVMMRRMQELSLTRGAAHGRRDNKHAALRFGQHRDPALESQPDCAFTARLVVRAVG